MKRTLVAALMLTFFAGVLSAQEPGQVTRAYPLKWRSPSEMSALIGPFLGSKLQVHPIRSLNVLTVEASEEQQALVEELIRKYDRPARGLEFQFYILRAGRQGSGLENHLPEKIRQVLQEIASLTRYTSFELLDAPLLRTSEGQRVARLSGRARYLYDLKVVGPRLILSKGKPARIRIPQFEIEFQVPFGDKYRSVGMATSFTLDDGETIVLGASQIRADRNVGDAFITLVSARLLDQGKE